METLEVRREGQHPQRELSRPHADECRFVDAGPHAIDEPFSRWGDVFSDHVVAAMIDRIVHHADVLTLKGNSYRLRNTEINTLPSMRTDHTAD
jgi:hypothetical protein